MERRRGHRSQAGGKAIWRKEYRWWVIEDDQQNYTRFCCIRRVRKWPGNDKTGRLHVLRNAWACFPARGVILVIYTSNGTTQEHGHCCEIAETVWGAGYIFGPFEVFKAPSSSSTTIPKSPQNHS